MYTPVHMEREYRVAKKSGHELLDGCGLVSPGSAKSELQNALAVSSSPTPGLRAARPGDRLIGGGVVLRTIKGMGTIYDWRKSSWTPRSFSGNIPVLLFVHHIPVVPNMAGIADFVRLRDVLVAQGLMVQTTTDRDGNVGLFTPFNAGCYQAKGANSFSCGCEHMHLTIGETWTKKQLRASAWLVQRCNDKHGTPLSKARLASGSGVVRVVTRGQTTHKDVSHYAGYNDRSDPGSGYDFEYVAHCVRYFNQHGDFANA